MTARGRLCGVMVHYGDLERTLRSVNAVIENHPDLELVLVNNGPQALDQVRTATPRGVSVINDGTNLGFGAGANRGIEHTVREGARDVVILPSDGRLPRGSLVALREEAERQGTTIASPLVLYEGTDLIWADGLSVSAVWGVVRNIGRGEPRSAAHGTRSVPHVTGHCMLLRGCDERPWLRFDEDYFLYYEDVAICDAATLRGEQVLVTDRVLVYHDKPGNVSYRFGAAQQRHMARSGLIYWAKAVRGWRRFTYLIGFVALTGHRTMRSANLRAAGAVAGGLASGTVAAVRILARRTGSSR